MINVPTAITKSEKAIVKYLSDCECQNDTETVIALGILIRHSSMVSASTMWGGTAITMLQNLIVELEEQAKQEEAETPTNLKIH